jgi:DNA-directed RNA polymerase beta subunit
LSFILGLAAKKLGYQAIVPLFGGATVEEVKDELEKAGYERDGRMLPFTTDEQERLSHKESLLDTCTCSSFTI